MTGAFAKTKYIFKTSKNYRFYKMEFNYDKLNQT